MLHDLYVSGIYAIYSFGLHLSFREAYKFDFVKFLAPYTAALPVFFHVFAKFQNPSAVAFRTYRGSRLQPKTSDNSLDFQKVAEAPEATTNQRLDAVKSHKSLSIHELTR